MAALTYQYVPYSPPREENLFLEEYYCSTDTQIFMDDINQTEISYISYSLQEQLKPIYGYASNTFDDIAIGNRIVTGMFKVSIKNPEGNASIHDVRNEISNVGNTSDSRTHNDKEEELKKDLEWIHNNINSAEKEYDETNDDASYPTISDEELDYISKLLELGYNIDYGATPTELKQAVREFQSKNNLDATDGTLNEATKEAIDEAYELLKKKEGDEAETLKVKIGTKIYSGPGILYDSFIVTSDTTAMIIDDSMGMWVYVVLENGENGWMIR